MGEEQLIRLAASGDRRAMEDLAVRFYPPVHAFCRKLCPQEAQDLAQAVMVRMIERLYQYRASGPSFTSWLFSIAYHLFIDSTRRRKTQPAGDEVFAALADPSDAYGNVDTGEHARSLLAALSEELRAMVVLRYYMDLGHEDIARIMNTSAKRVKWRLNDALERMRKEERKRAGQSKEAMG